ncbi:MAG: ATP translocase [Pseudomonadota bacterium]
MNTSSNSQYSAYERVLSLFAKIHAGEGRSVIFLFLNSFFLLFAYYLLKPVREALVLAEGGAEVRSYAVAAQAILLLLAIPLYGLLFRGKRRLELLRVITLFFASNLLVFCVLGLLHVNIGIPFFIWLGILSVTLVAQFWAFAADLYNVEAGHRLFALIAAGSTLGALVGSEVTKLLLAYFGTYGMMLVAAAVMALTVVLSDHANRSVPEQSRGAKDEVMGLDTQASILQGFSIVAKDRYLLLITAFVLLLNCINSTGEFILAKVVIERAEALVLADATQHLTKSAAIGTLYGDFYFWVNLITLFLQLFMVRRIWQLIGIRGALLISPFIAFVGYGLVALVPVFAIVRWVKIAENSSDYSIQSTTRHALFLPVSRVKKYQGKTCIDTFFWRLGDLIQALVVYVGLNVFDFGIKHFALVNCVLSALWIIVAVQIDLMYRRHTLPRGADTEHDPIE